MPVAPTKAPPSETIADAMRLRESIEGGQVPAEYLESWMRGRMTDIHEIIEQYANEKIRVSVATKEEGEKMPTVAWTEPDADGVKHIKIKAEEIIQYAFDWDPQTKRVEADITEFSTMLSGLLYHEMGHVIVTPRVIDSAPDAAFFYKMHIMSFSQFLETLPKKDLAKLLILTNLLNSYSDVVGRGHDRSVGQTYQPFMAEVSAVVGDIVGPWIRQRIDYIPPTTKADVNTWLTHRGSEGILELREGSASDYSLEKAPSIAGDMAGLFRGIDGGEGMQAGEVRITPVPDAEAIVKSLEDGLRMLSNFDKLIVREENMYTHAAEQALLQLQGKASSSEVVGAVKVRWEPILNFWHYCFNLLEDQRLESQLADYYGGMGGYFTRMVTRLMDAKTRYPLTAGRRYIKFADKDREMFEAATRTDSSLPPAAGFIPWMRPLAFAYIDLNSETDLERMAHLTSLYMFIYRLFHGVGYDVPKPTFDPPELQDDDIMQKPAKRDKKQQKEMADKETEKKKGTEMIEKAANADPNAKLKADIANVLGAARRVLVDAAAIYHAEKDLKSSHTAERDADDRRKAAEKEMGI